MHVPARMMQPKPSFLLLGLAAKKQALRHPTLIACAHATNDRGDVAMSILCTCGACSGQPCLVIEVAVEAEDVGVAQVRLDLNFPPQLVLYVRLLQLRLE